MSGRLEMNNPQDHLDGDYGFRGVEMRLDPATLATGWVASARNCRFRKGKGETRPGIVKLSWTHHLGTAFPMMFGLTFDETLPFATVYGAGRFDDPNGVEWILIAGVRLESGGKVWTTRPNNTLIEEPLPAGETITGPCSFVQAVDKVILFRGEDAAPLVLEEAGTGKGFRHLNAPEDGTGLELIPNAERALFFQNRLIIPHGRDLVDVTDALDPEHVDAVFNRFRINQGSSDRLVGVYKFNDDTLICAKEASVYALTNLAPDAAGRFSSAQLDAVTTSWGFVAGKSVVQAGTDLIGLSQLGVMSIQQTEQNKLQSVVQPLSASIQPLIDRINWRYAAGACAAYWDSKYFLAVPLDDAEKLGGNLVPAGTLYPSDGSNVKLIGLEAGRKYRVRFGANDRYAHVSGSNQVILFENAPAGFGGDFVAGITPDMDLGGNSSWMKLTPQFGIGAQPVTTSIQEIYSGVNNAVLVYDFVTGSWCGSDDGPGLMVTDFVQLFYQGRQRLFFMSPDGFLNLYEEGFEDQVYQWTAYPPLLLDDYTRDVGVRGREIETELVTRGYGTRQLENNGLNQKAMGEVWARELLVAVATWDPMYSIYERPDGVSEETALVDGKTKSRTRYDQWNKAGWDPTNVNGDHETARREDYSVTFDVAGGVNLGTGLNPELMQESMERLRMRTRGGAVQVRVLNRQGRIEVKRMELVTLAGRKRMGVLI